MKVGVGSLCGFFLVRFPLLEPFALGAPLGVGRRLASGSAHGNGEAETAIAATRKASMMRIVDRLTFGGDCFAEAVYGLLSGVVKFQKAKDE